MSFLYERDRGAAKWRHILALCEKHDGALEEIVFPKRHKTDASCRVRRSVLSDLWMDDWNIRDLMMICPLSERAIRRAVNMG